LQEIVQEFARRPDERFPLPVFVKARRFPHEHYARLSISHTEHHLGAAHLRKFAPLAVVQRCGEVLERHGLPHDNNVELFYEGF